MDAVRADIRGVVLNDIRAEVSEFSPAEYYYQYYANDSSLKEEPGLLQKALGRLRSHSSRHRTRPLRDRDANDRTGSPRGSHEYEKVLQVTEDLKGKDDSTTNRLD